MHASAGDVSQMAETGIHLAHFLDLHGPAPETASRHRAAVIRHLIFTVG